MEDFYSQTDALGPLKIIQVQERSIGLQAILVIDNLAMGPALGGMRMAKGVTLEECARLARAMTLKNAAAGLAHGGGKMVIEGDPHMPKADKERIIRGLAQALKSEIDYIFAPDMGMDEECMAWIRDEVPRVVGLPRELGGIPLDEIGATGWGLCQAAEIAAPYCSLALDGARIAIQGFGAVGIHAARFLAEKGAVLVAAADSRGAIYDARGLDLAQLMALKQQGQSVADYPQGQKLTTTDLVAVPCDLWIPAARPDVLREDNIHLLEAKLVVQGANIPMTAAAERSFYERGGLYVPDFIANAGGVICAAMEYRGADESAVMDAIADKVRRNTEAVLSKAKSEGKHPRQAAEEIAQERLTKAMGFRRWSTFSSSPNYL